MNTHSKKILIILIYIALFALFVYGLIKIFTPKKTCFDNIKNQNEEGVDCGGICEKACDNIVAKDLIIEETGFVPSGLPGKYDFYAKIANPNAIFGGREIEYAVSLKSGSSVNSAEKINSSFILPGETKYIFEQNLETSGTPDSADFKITKVDWKRFDEYYEKPDVKIINKNYNEVSGGTTFSEAKGLIKNNGAYDFSVIKVKVLLRDDQKKVIAMNSTEVKTVKSGEVRELTVFWPSRFSGTVFDMDVQSEINSFDSEVFHEKPYSANPF